jgi:hypothetical protein
MTYSEHSTELNRIRVKKPRVRVGAWAEPRFVRFLKIGSILANWPETNVEFCRTPNSAYREVRWSSGTTRNWAIRISIANALNPKSEADQYAAVSLPVTVRGLFTLLL